MVVERQLGIKQFRWLFFICSFRLTILYSALLPCNPICMNGIYKLWFPLSLTNGEHQHSLIRESCKSKIRVFRGQIVFQLLPYEVEVVLDVSPSQGLNAWQSFSFTLPSLCLDLANWSLSGLEVVTGRSTMETPGFCNILA